MNLLLLVIVNIICIVVCHSVAKSRGARPVFWGLMGAIFGPLAIPFVVFAQPESGNNASGHLGKKRSAD